MYYVVQTESSNLTIPVSKRSPFYLFISESQGLNKVFFATGSFEGVALSSNGKISGAFTSVTS